MSIEIKVPALPESVADAVIASWYKQVGDSIDADEVLVDLETDKVILEVPSIKKGVVKELLFSVGDTVVAGQLLAMIDDEAVTAAKSEVSDVDDSKAQAQSPDDSAPMSPSVRKLVAEHSIDVSQLRGSGKNGRIIKQDTHYLASWYMPQVTAPTKKLS